MFDYDLIILGGGSGGVAMARRAASYGARVALCEEDRYGGTCVHRGCVPKKLLVYGASFAEEFRSAPGYGWTLGETRFDWPSLVAAKDGELERLNGYYNRILEESGVVKALGRARLVDGHTVEVGERRLIGRYLVLAVGGRPQLPAVSGIERAITSNEAFHLPRLPERLAVVGSGYIGVEFACIFHQLGSQVTLLFRSDRLLPKFDQDVRLTLGDELEKKGLRILTGRHVQELGEGRLTTREGDVLEVDTVLYATGRIPNTAGLGLEELGIELDGQGAVKVNEDLRTSLDSVYALGDCTGRVQLTPVAIAEGRALAETLFHDNPTRVSYANIPTAVFSIPPVGVVGLTEAQAREEGPVRIYRARFRPMKHALTGKDEKVLLKLVVDDRSDRVVGAHMVGADAPEIIQCLAVALQGGATKAQFDRTLALHPSVSEEFVLMREPVAT